jgi:hypothetical protein
MKWLKWLKGVRVGLAAVAAVVFASGAWAIPFHYLVGAGDADPTAPITASGNTPVGLNDLTAADLAGVQVLWITNGSNSGPPNAVTSNLAAIAEFVRSGGVLSYHDRYVGGGGFDMASVLPGAGGVEFIRNEWTNTSDIDILNNTTIVTNGLNNTSLDNGNLSSHGYARSATLPAGAVAILNRGGALDEIVDFYYPFGAGWVYYSTIPLDFYLAGYGNNPPGDAMRDIYAVNEARFQASLANGVPEPGTMALLGLALAGMGFLRRRAT